MRPFQAKTVPEKIEIRTKVIVDIANAFFKTASFPFDVIGLMFFITDIIKCTIDDENFLRIEHLFSPQAKKMYPQKGEQIMQTYGV
jgi:hypothetical protein